MFTSYYTAVWGDASWVCPESIDFGRLFIPKTRLLLSLNLRPCSAYSFNTFLHTESLALLQIINTHYIGMCPFLPYAVIFQGNVSLQSQLSLHFKPRMIQARFGIIDISKQSPKWPFFLFTTQERTSVIMSHRLSPTSQFLYPSLVSFSLFFILYLNFQFWPFKCMQVSYQRQFLLLFEMQEVKSNKNLHT